ncbi:hypothetical protein [Streptomyces graminilatus]|uniref:hypothetical protein n=1 Tax=Streptomyces graminilatus TaxID=1464070 RepID=UPI0006E45DA9|nr:hypothetical protein [Streptomyces graminilatus]
MTDYAEKYAEALDPRVLNYFPRSSPTQYAETTLFGWLPTEDLPEHHRWLAAVMFRSQDGDSTLKGALALADDTGHLTWNPDAMSDRSTRRRALMSYWLWAEEIQRTYQEGDRLIREALPVFGVDPDNTDIGLAWDLFETTLSADEYGRSAREGR